MSDEEDKDLKEKEVELAERERELELKELAYAEIRKVDELVRHLDNVQDACLRLGKALIFEGEIQFGINLIANSRIHDFSKFHGIEWKYLTRNAADDDKDKFLDAIMQHQQTNEHHPEFWGDINQMPRIYVAEMVCDWYARSIEMGTDLREFFQEKAIERYKISKQGKKYKEIRFFIDMILDKPFKPVKKDT